MRLVRCDSKNTLLACRKVSENEQTNAIPERNRDKKEELYVEAVYQDGWWDFGRGDLPSCAVGEEWRNV